MLVKKKLINTGCKMFERITILIGSRGFAAFLTSIVLILILPLFVHIFYLLGIENVDHKKELISLVKDQENIALILIGAGTFLAGRKVLLSWLDVIVNPDDASKDASIPQCEITGFCLILLGSLMEILDQLILNIEGFFEIGVILDVVINLPLNILALIMLTKLLISLTFGKKS